MNWRFWKKPVDVIPNPRDRRKHIDRMESIQRDVLATLQFFVFMLLLMLALVVS